MANSIRILELLKWYTDEKHPLTQEKLRSKPGADECLGYKTTFKRRLFEIADILNADAPSEKEWRIVFPGYAHQEDLHTMNRHYIGPIFYRHEIQTHELDFLMNHIQASNQLTQDEKRALSDKLVKLLGSVHYSYSAYANRNEILEISGSDGNHLNHNLNFLRDAITNEKMIVFRTTVLDVSGQYVPAKEAPHMVSPYRIIFYKGTYWLLGNERLGKYATTNGQFIKYSDTLDVFRVDKMVDLQIAQETLEKKAKYFLSTPLHLRILEKVLFYKERQKIKYTDIADDFGRIAFEILWENFPESQRYDYSFIKDTFGTNYEITTNHAQTTVHVQCTNDFFLDWALGYVDRIRILDMYPTALTLKKPLRSRLERGLENL